MYRDSSLILKFNEGSSNAGSSEYFLSKETASIALGQSFALYYLLRAEYKFLIIIKYLFREKSIIKYT